MHLPCSLAGKDDNVEDDVEDEEENGSGPAGVETADALEMADATEATAAVDAGGVEMVGRTGQLPKKSMPAEWVEVMTEDGQKYYHNKQTGVTSWERPVEYDMSMVLDEEAGLEPSGASAETVGLTMNPLHKQVSATKGASSVHMGPG